MNEIAVNVRGSHTTTIPPERGIVHVVASLEGAQPKPVFDETARLVDLVRSRIEQLHDDRDGPITWFSIDRMHTSARRPWHKDGKQLPLIHSATVGVNVRFKDFDALSNWVAWGAGVEGLTVQHIEWSLTESTRRDVERDARRQAVLVAQERAQDYADALSLGPVQVSMINDSGLRPAEHLQRMTMDADFLADEGSPSVGLAPEHVEIAATVEASFLVRPDR